MALARDLTVSSLSVAGSYPKSKPDWNNLSVIHRNTLPPRASFYSYLSESDALSYNTTKSTSQSLSGTWKFLLSNSPAEAPDFSKTDVSKWCNIKVPSMWQLEGHGSGPHYSNVNYIFPVDPPNVPSNENETGSYHRNFEIPEEWQGTQIRLRFEGVDSSFHVWINGKDVGYSQGARNPSEFDITNFIKKGKNTIAVRVYKWCDGSYIERQDQWTLSGIFRDVHLLSFPKTHIEDFHVQTLLDEKYEDATLSVAVELSGSSNSSIALKLLDASGKVVCEDQKESTSSVKFELPITNPLKWTAESPNLYNLVLSTSDQVIAQRVGFRKTELKDGLFLVNGKRVVFRGANRHEHHPDLGRSVPYEFLKQDLLLMKSHNINAIRTCHQPSDPRLYDLADELGLWVMDEADLECHGFSEIDEASLPEDQRKLSFEERKRIIYGAAGRWTSDNLQWKDAYLDRAKQLVMRDKNHASVIMWSLGNEAFYGRNFQSMYDWIKSYDSTRLVHYEGDFEAKTVDVYSMMYPKIDLIVEFAKEKNFEKPLVLCEFIHAMGNGPGAIKEYIDAFYEYPRLQGGFVWEWANHGLRTKSADGDEYYGYGGDFGDVPNDGNFVMDGVLFSDHTPTPGLLEYKKAIEPVQIISDLKGGKIAIINRYDFITLDHLKCEWSLVGDKNFTRTGGEVEVPAGIHPQDVVELTIPPEALKDLPPTETYLQLTFTLREPTLWANAGHEVAWGQVQLRKPKPLPLPFDCNRPTINQISPTILEVRTSHSDSTWRFCLVRGTIISWTKNSEELIHTPPTIDFYRALTDNDSPSDGWHWKDKRLHQTKSHVRSINWQSGASKASITVKTRVAPPVLEWSVDMTITYTFTNTDIHINVKGAPQGKNLPATFSRIGLTLSLHDMVTATWFGRGPGESYVDKKESQKFGTWKSSIDELFTDYEFPQETSNRTDVRWVVVANEAGRGIKARFGDAKGASFMACHYSTKDLDECKHPFELHKRKKDEVVLRLDWRHHGLGTGSCGPKTLDKYALKSEEFEFEVLLE